MVTNEPEFTHSDEGETVPPAPALIVRSYWGSPVQLVSAIALFIVTEDDEVLPEVRTRYPLPLHEVKTCNLAS